jgi:hypothetical protein
MKIMKIMKITQSINIQFNKTEIKSHLNLPKCVNVYTFSYILYIGVFSWNSFLCHLIALPEPVIILESNAVERSDRVSRF